MNFKNNPEYKCVFTLKRSEQGQSDINFYQLEAKDQYHISRFVAASAQNIYSGSGVTSELLNQIMDNIIKMCNSKEVTTTIKTDIALLANQVKYRTKYPVDEKCAIRMGAIYTFMDGEDPNKVVDIWTQRKVALAEENPDLYAFFLQMGMAYTASYRESLALLNDTEYFSSRAEAIKSMTPEVLRPK